MGDKLTPESHAILAEATKDKELSPTEAAEIKALLEKLDPEEISKLDAEIQAVLGNTIAELHPETVNLVSEGKETIGETEYSMEYLQKNSDGFLKKVLDLEISPGISAIDAFFVGQSMKHFGTNIPESMSHTGVKENLKILLWSKIIDGVSASSLFNFGVKGITEQLSFNNQESEKNDNLSVGGIAEMVEGISKLGEGEEIEDVSGVIEINVPGGGTVEKQVPKALELAFNYLESLTSSYFVNLTLLHETADSKGISDSSEFTQLLQHPGIMKVVLETGIYNDEGMNINLSEGTLDIQNISDSNIDEVQKEFLTDVLEQTNTTSGSVDTLMKQREGWMKMFDVLGISPEEFKNGLKSMLDFVGLGWVVDVLLGDFFESFSSKVNKLNEAPDIKQAMTNFAQYIENSENTEKLPFTLREDNPGKLNDDEVGVVKDFIKKLKNNIPGNTEEEKQANIDKILSDPKLAEKLLTGQSIAETDTFLRQVHDIIKGMFSSENKPSQEDFFNTLKDAKISVEELPLKEDGADTDSAIISTGVLGEEMAEVKDFPSLESQITNISTFPAKIILENGAEQIITFDGTSKSIIIGEKNFTITSMVREGESTELIGDAFSLDNLIFSGGKGLLSLQATEKGKALVFAANFTKEEGTPDITLEDGDILNVTLTADDIQKMLLGLLQESTYKTTQSGIKITVE